MFCAGFFHTRKTFFNFFSKKSYKSHFAGQCYAERGRYQLLHNAERGVMMKPTSFEDAVRLQFDTLMKKVIDKTIKNYERSLTRRNKREVLFCELPEIMVQSFPVFDEYDLDVADYDVYGMTAHVCDKELCNALDQLSEKRRNTILLFYFLDMSDIEISELMNITRCTSYTRRMTALRQMKEILEKGK